MTRCFFTAIAVVLFTTASFAQTSSLYRFVELKIPNDSFWAVASSVDRNRNVYGHIFYLGPQIPKAIRWMAATAWAPEVLNEDAVMAASNAAGFVVGSHNGSASLWDQSGSITALSGMPANVNSSASDINRRQEACGNFSSEDTRHAFRWLLPEGGSQLPPLGTLNHSAASGINDAGFVVGTAHDTEPQPTVMSPWIWTRTGSIQMLPKPSSFSAADDINNTGLIVGWGRVSGYARAVSWPIFGPAQLLTNPPGQDNAMAAAVTDGGLIVGTAWTGKWNKRSNERAVLWDGALTYDLTSLFDQNAAWTLLSAADANSRGDIVGTGTFNGKATGYLLIRKA